MKGREIPAIVIGSAVFYPRIVSPALRQHLALRFLDYRGFAASPGQVEQTEFSLNELIDDVERARRELGLGRVAVIGHSGHAYLALDYAKRHPANVSHVIMIGIFPDLTEAAWATAERNWFESVSPEQKAASGTSPYGYLNTADIRLLARNPSTSTVSFCTGFKITPEPALLRGLLVACRLSVGQGQVGGAELRGDRR